MRKNQALSGASAGQKPCVLIVDDNQDALAALAELIDDFGFDVQVAYNGELALSMIHTAKPRCVVFDVDMPIMDGHALAQTLRTYLGRSVVLIGMSGHPPEDPRIAPVATCGMPIRHRPRWTRRPWSRWPVPRRRPSSWRANY